MIHTRRQEAVDHLQEGRVDKLIVLQQQNHLLAFQTCHLHHLRHISVRMLLLFAHNSRVHILTRDTARPLLFTKLQLIMSIGEAPIHVFHPGLQSSSLVEFF